MKKFVIVSTVTLLLGFTATAQDVSNIRVQQHDSVLIVMYDLASKADIEAFVSFDGGTTYRGPLKHVTGAVGKDISPEKNKMFMWDIVSEVGYVDYDNTVIKIVALGSDSHGNAEAYSPDGIDMVYVAAGANSGITITNGFYIGRYEVTQTQWQAIMGNNPSRFKGDNLPVDKVSWDDVQEFITRLNQMTGRNYRLPTEAEWEFAARGGTTGSFCSGGCEYSGSDDLDYVAWYNKNSSKRTHAVGTKKPNELGIYDMSGNVWEWCEDSLGSDRVIRGGGWGNFGANTCRIVSRNSINPRYSTNYVGFRLVLIQ